jgi:hypothetical protein
MSPAPEPSLLSFLPLILIGVIFAVPAYMLAVEKGRNPWKWVILCLIPFVNIFCIWYFVGTPSTRLERKIDELLKAQGRSVEP